MFLVYVVDYNSKNDKHKKFNQNIVQIETYGFDSLEEANEFGKWFFEKHLTSYEKKRTKVYVDFDEDLDYKDIDVNSDEFYDSEEA